MQVYPGTASGACTWHKVIGFNYQYTRFLSEQVVPWIIEGEEGLETYATMGACLTRLRDRENCSHAVCECKKHGYWYRSFGYSFHSYSLIQCKIHGGNGSE